MRSVLIFLLGGILGMAFGIAVAVFAYPFVFPPPPANEQVSEAERVGLVAKGVFIHAEPSDPLHYGQGDVVVYQKLVHLTKNFKVGPGPKFHVYLSPKAGIRSSADFSSADSLDLGRLRAFEGSQKYSVPAGTDLSKYKSVVIWCEQFSVLVSPADLVR